MFERGFTTRRLHRGHDAWRGAGSLHAARPTISVWIASNPLAPFVMRVCFAALRPKAVSVCYNAQRRRESCLFVKGFGELPLP